MTDQPGTMTIATIASFKRALTVGSEVDIENPSMPRMNRRATVLASRSEYVVLSHPDAPKGSHLAWPKKGRIGTDGGAFFLLDAGDLTPWLIVKPVAAEK